jgi:hypothetical protein
MEKIPSLSLRERQVPFSRWSDGPDTQIAVTQSISGTGALRIATGFLTQYFQGPKKVYLPDPTWGNHIPIVEGTGLEVVRYRSVPIFLYGSCLLVGTLTKRLSDLTLRV